MNIQLHHFHLANLLISLLHLTLYMKTHLIMLHMLLNNPFFS